MTDNASRRWFLKVSGAGALGGAVAPAVAQTTPGTAKTLLAYPRKAVAMSSKVSTGAPVSFTYPDAASPCLAVKIGSAVPGGVGPDDDIVAFSSLVHSHGLSRHLRQRQPRPSSARCHFSMFDAEKGGQMICGQATENLPRVRLEHRRKTGADLRRWCRGI